MFESKLPEPGSHVDEFRIAKLLGMGGCAAVYQAAQERMGRDVAIKIILPEAAESIPGLVDRFDREIGIIKRLEHPNIVRLYNFGHSDEGLTWMAMELVRGVELTDVLREKGRLLPQRTIPIILQVLSALAAAHKLQIVHRDLKPQNIMLTEQGAEEDVVKLLDFGIGKAIGEAESSASKDITAVHGPSTGTPQYLAPELIKEDKLGPYSDVYAVGLIFFEILMGRPAVSGNSLFEIIAQQVGTAIAFPPWLESSPLGPVLHKALEKDPANRYPTALEFYRDLKNVDPAQVVVDPDWAAEVDAAHAEKRAAVREQPAGDFSFGSSLSPFINPNANPDDTIPFTPDFAAFNDPSLPQLPQSSSSAFGLPSPPPGFATPAPPSPTPAPPPPTSHPSEKPADKPRVQPGRSKANDQQARVRVILIGLILVLVLAILAILFAIITR